MSNNSYFIRDYTKINLVDDLIKVFPKLKDSINIPRSDGTFTLGRILLSSFNFNQYALFNAILNVWFIQTWFFDKNGSIDIKYICIEDLKYSNFSIEEIKNINEALVKGIRADFTKISPDFQPLPDINLDFNPDIFLNPPPLKL